MTDAKQMQFGQRLRRIDHNHRKLAKGFVTSMNHDGLLIARPVRTDLRFTWRGVAYVIIVMMAFKIFLHAQIGAEAYQARVVALQNGSITAQLGAYAMTADPITVAFANAMGKAAD
ncbi:MAG: hypothetical protein V3U96_08335 [Paracoccaceae bacterium]